MTRITSPQIDHTTTAKWLQQLSDQRLQEQMERALNSAGCYSLRQIRISIERGRATLNGVVPSYYLKQIAQTIVMKFDEVGSLQNLLTVHS